MLDTNTNPQGSGKISMTNLVIINGQSVDLTDRKAQCETFGKQFRGTATPEEYIKMCDERIKKYEMYISNLKELRQQKLVEKADEHKDELKAMLSAMSREELTEFISTLNQ